METKVAYQVAADDPLVVVDIGCTMDAAWRRLSTRNLDELERDLAKLERELVPLLNRLRAMRGKKPVIVPEG